MGNIYLFSGPCGCGKSTLANAYAKHLVNECGRMQAYVIHGDTFHAGFVETDHTRDFTSDGQSANMLPWEKILKFNWDCILSVSGMVLERGLDVIVDYVVEDELPLMKKLAVQFGAKLYYVVLTASEETIQQRITQRGDVDLIERALFLKKKLDGLPENQGHLLDNTEKTVDQEVAELEIERFEVPLNKIG